MVRYMKDLNYYAIMYGGVPMTANGALRFMIAAEQAGHNHFDVLQYIPDEFLMPDAYREKHTKR